MTKAQVLEALEALRKQYGVIGNDCLDRAIAAVNAIEDGEVVVCEGVVYGTGRYWVVEHGELPLCQGLPTGDWSQFDGQRVNLLLRGR